ncbi:MAG: radical SAM protein [Nanoarchaeota archaeon]
MSDLGIGTACNNCCIMCTTLRKPELSNAKQTKRKRENIIREVEKLNNPGQISITGGEPTIRNDLIELIKKIKETHPLTELRVLTNARRLYYKQYAKDLVSAGVDGFVVPLHAHCSEMHDFIARAKGSFRQTMQGLYNLGNLDRISIEMRIVIHGLNYPFIPDTAQLISKHFPFAKVVMLYYDSIGSAHINREKLMVNISKAAPYVEEACDIFKQPKEIYHFPLCLLREPYRKFSAGQTVEDIRIVYTKKCNACSMKDECPKLWKTYWHHKGEGELSPLK